MPPRRAPAEAPADATALQTPSARARVVGSVKVAVMIVKVAGARMAAPNPCSARAPINIAWFCDKPPIRLETVKMARPAMKMRLRPNRSAARPPSSMKPAKVRVYALTTHWRPDPLKPRSFWIDGSATFTMETSRTTMNWPTQTRVRRSHAATVRPGTTSITRRAGAEVAVVLIGLLATVGGTATAGTARKRRGRSPAGSNVRLFRSIPFATLGVQDGLTWFVVTDSGRATEFAPSPGQRGTR